MSTLEAAEPREIQRQRALVRANEVRVKRAEIKRKIKDYELDPVEVLSDPDEFAAGMTIEQVITALPRFGQYRVLTITAGICRPTLTLERMGDHTRSRLIGRIEDALGR